uniref:SURF1-like protein n=1 Tax=Branchiostoma floridae TaxID=7739 RepID=C3ZG60_BRAFL|eukprot:XP_002592524.1 hypothetical protein BRAFLDRAFT_118944 [Branchiostoma floridae]
MSSFSFSRATLQCVRKGSQCGLFAAKNRTFCPGKRSASQAASRSSSLPPPHAWFLLSIPAAAFGLGTWQVQRRQWKLDLIKDMEARTSRLPVHIPSEQQELETMEYRPVKVRGTFDHSKEMYLLPRSLNTHDTGGGMGARAQSGAQVVTPFHCLDTGRTILVNRGWVSKKNINPATRPDGQVTGEVEVTGLVRLNEKRAPFVPKNDIAHNRWHYRDVEAMAQLTEAQPIYIEAVGGSTVPGGPIGGQTRVQLRNEHMQYILTWYSLSFLTALGWYWTYFKKVPR